MPIPHSKRKSTFAPCNCNKNKFTTPLYHSHYYDHVHEHDHQPPLDQHDDIIEEDKVSVVEGPVVSKEVIISDEQPENICNTENVCEHIKQLENKIHILTQQVLELQEKNK